MLTEAEKQAGREFREDMAAKLAKSLHTTAPCSPYIREYRHDCTARGGVSWPLRLKEHVIASPEYDGVAAGRFTWTWLAGHCRCGLAVRSITGRLAVRD